MRARDPYLTPHMSRAQAPGRALGQARAAQAGPQLGAAGEWLVGGEGGQPRSGARARPIGPARGLGPADAKCKVGVSCMYICFC